MSTLFIPFSLFFLITSPYFLNDVIQIFTSESSLWFGVDYGTRLLSLGLLVFAIHRYQRSYTSLGLRFTVPLMGWGVALVFTLLGTLFLQALSTLSPYIQPTVLNPFPHYVGEWHRALDLSLGLMLVALSEELIFRGLFAAFFHEILKTGRSMVLFSGLFFALIHWSSGVDAVVGAFVWGVFAMLFYRYYQSIIPLIVVHFLTNFALYSGWVF